MGLQGSLDEQLREWCRGERERENGKKRRREGLLGGCGRGGGAVSLQSENWHYRLKKKK